jgi:hypothetical protein
LGHEVEKYDQLCDSIESHMARMASHILCIFTNKKHVLDFQLRAISVLQRDLLREEHRIKAAETASIASRTRSKSTSMSPTSTRAPLPSVLGTDATSASEASQPPTGNAPASTSPQPSPPRPGSSAIPGRRPSAISISSLHRPVFPLKLDLSSTALRITAEEASLFSSGLASPVTLAPKSARPIGPNEFPSEFMVAFASASSTTEAANTSVDLDLTVPDTDINAGNDVEMNLDAAIGNSADKPIELDLEAMDIDMQDMTELFGDAPDSASNDGNTTVDGLFSPVTGGTDMAMQGTDGVGKTVKEEEKLEMELLDVFNGVGDSSGGDMFAAFGSNAERNTQSHQNNSESQLLGVPAVSTAQSAPSPGTLLASFASPSHLNVVEPSSASNSNTLPSGDTPFDLTSLDLSHLSPGFFTNEQGSDMNLMEMEELLNIGGQEDTESVTNPNGTKSGL